jgi:hypothetical protein
MGQLFYGFVLGELFLFGNLIEILAMFFYELFCEVAANYALWVYLWVDVYAWVYDGYVSVNWYLLHHL